MNNLENFTLETFFQTCLAFRQHCINNFTAHCRILEAVSELEGTDKYGLPKVWSTREVKKLIKALKAFEGYENISYRHLASMTYISIHRPNVMTGEIEKFEHLLYYDSNRTIDANNFAKIDSWKYSNDRVKQIDYYLQGSYKKPSSKIIMQYNKYLKFFKAIEELKQMAKELRNNNFCADYYVSNPILEEMFGKNKNDFQNAF